MLRQRRGKKPTPSARRKGRLANSSNTFAISFATILNFIGIRPIQPNPKRTAQQKTALIFDAVIATVLFVIAVATRFYRLEFPPKIVFDEFHFAAFVDQYVRGEYLFDIHPPLGKLTLTAVAMLAGYQPPQNFTFSSLGQPFGPVMYYPQRAFSALAGSFIPPVMYLTARALSFAIIPSITTAAMPLLDILLCIESRLILTDSQLVLYLQLSYFFAFLLWQTPRSTPRRYVLVCLTALAAASALSTKWTAFVAPVMIAFISLTGIIFEHARLDIVEMVIAAVIAATIYIGSFWIHFALLQKSGRGDAFMQMTFRSTLPGSEFYNPKAVRPSFIQNFRYLNWEMLRANSAIRTRHHWESKWYQWLYNARGVLYLDEHLPENRRERIYIIMNPFLPILTGLGVILSVGVIMYVLVRALKPKKAKVVEPSKKKGGRGNKKNDDASESDWEKEVGIGMSVEEKKWKEEKSQAGLLSVLVVAWAGNLLPYIGVQRCTFLYHVLPALQIASLMTGVMLQKITPRYGIRTIVCVVVVAVLVGAFWWWRAWTYGLHRTVKELDQLRWMSGWN